MRVLSSGAGSQGGGGRELIEHYENPRGNAPFAHSCQSHRLEHQHPRDRLDWDRATAEPAGVRVAPGEINLHLREEQVVIEQPTELGQSSGSRTPARAW